MVLDIHMQYTCTGQISTLNDYVYEFVYMQALIARQAINYTDYGYFWLGLKQSDHG